MLIPILNIFLVIKDSQTFLCAIFTQFSDSLNYSIGHEVPKEGTLDASDDGRSEKQDDMLSFRKSKVGDLSKEIAK